MISWGNSNVHKKIISYLSNGTLLAGAVIGIYALLNIYLIKRNLPEGSCPVTNNRPLLYTALALCCISFITSFFDAKETK